CLLMASRPDRNDPRISRFHANCLSFDYRRNRCRRTFAELLVSLRSCPNWKDRCCRSRLCLASRWDCNRPGELSEKGREKAWLCLGGDVETGWREGDTYLCAGLYKPTCQLCKRRLLADGDAVE